MADPALRRRAGIAVLLGVVAVVMFILVTPDAPHNSVPVSRPLIASTDSLVDSFLLEKGIDRKKERKWSVRNPEGKVLRIERRIQISPDLITLELNRDLNEAVTALGGHVAGTERTKGGTVVLHIVIDATTVHTLTLEPQQSR